MFNSLTLACAKAVQSLWASCGRFCGQLGSLPHHPQLTLSLAWKNHEQVHTLNTFSTQAFPTPKVISVSVKSWLYTFYTPLIKTTTNCIKENV